MLQAVAGISLHDQKDLPEKLCDGCLVNLQTAYGIRQQFVEADSILSEMVQNGDVPLVVSLQSQQSKPFVGRTIPEPNDFSNGERGYESRQSDIEKETKLDPNKCYICSEIFDNQEALNIHIPSHVDMIPYSCELCAENNGPRKIMKSLATLHRHFRMHAGTISCPKCPFQLCTVTGLYNHMQRYHSKGSDAGYVCEICGSKMSNRQDLKFHLRSHRALEDGRFTCRFCDKKLTTKSSLVQHERGHTNEKPFKCKYCEKCFNSESHRYTHERMHTGEKGYRCEHCSNCYRTSNALRQHQLTMHANMASVKPRSPQKRLYSQGPVKCNVEGCNFVTNNRATYYSHRNRHAMKHHCEHCSERFAIKESLLQHMYKHTGVKPFSCGLCGKGFLFKNSLNEHLDLHSDVRPYKCEICEMGFVRERTLRKHRLRHTVKKNYQCRFCVMQFKYEGTLTKHERSHAGTVPKSDQEECLEATKTLIVDGINCWVEEDSQ
ncbi:zinc finger protein ZFP2-like [Sabethes cyaneus]|uniref:zinc finger protein ZFP2-like n=1 Tax=Sabethes cyaneus TaxID=53552 RepID=UPI00237DD987|nr:zinc finger protein ZFP2-like [Sabethes cyaneus]